jgi:hypothetical protein
MGQLYHGHRIYIDEDDREVIRPVSFLWDNVLDLGGSKGVGLNFKNREPKTYVTFPNSRGMWILAPISKMRHLWSAYLGDEVELDFSINLN